MLAQTDQDLRILSSQNPVRKELVCVGTAAKTVQVFIAHDDTVGQLRYIDMAENKD